MGDVGDMTRPLSNDRRKRRFSPLVGLVLMVATGALWQAGLALGSSEKATPVHAAAKPVAAAAKPVVGEVTILSGTKNLYLQDDDGHKTALHRGDELRLDDTVLVGPGVKAELKLTRPKSVSPDRELVFVKPLNDTKYLVTLVRLTDTQVKVKILD